MGIPAGIAGISSLVYVGMISGEGAVYVGKRVAGISRINWAASVGSTVGVVRGVGVGGGSTMGMLPLTSTSGEYTQPVLSGTPG